MRMTNEEIIKKLSNVGNGFVFDKKTFSEIGAIFWKCTYEDILDGKYSVSVWLYCNAHIWSEHKVRRKDEYIDCVSMSYKLGSTNVEFDANRDKYMLEELLDMDIIRGLCNKFTKECVEKSTEKLIDSMNVVKEWK